MVKTNLKLSARQGYVLLFYKDNTDLYRLAVSSQHPENKIDQFNSEKGNQNLVLRYQIEVPDPVAAKKILSAAYKDYYIKDGNFKLNEDLVSEIISFMIDYSRMNPILLPSQKKQIQVESSKKNNINVILSIAILLVLGVNIIIIFKYLIIK
jgi:hypothetical protein